MSALRLKRADHLDVAKGLGIILVVVFHAWRGVVAAGGADVDTPGWAFADYLTYLFHMPVFFLISGVFVQQSLARGTWPFLRDKLLYIYWPYLLWSVVSILVAALLAGYVNKDIGIERILSVPLFPKLHYWFLFTLFLYFLLAVLIRSVRVLVAIAVAGVLLWHVPAVEAVAGRYVHFLLFFVAGMAWANHIRRFDPSYWLAAVGLLIAYAVVGFSLGIDTMSVLMIPGGFAGCYALLALACAISPDRLRGALRALGERSLAIYLLHILAASGTRIVLGRLFGNADPWLLLAAAILAGIALPLIAYEVARRLRLLTLSGLGKDARRPGGS